MMKYEIKKVFSKTGNKIALLILLLAVGIVCYFTMNVTYVDENGSTQSGPSAIAKLKAEQKQWSGYLDEATIEAVIAKNLEIRNSPEALSKNINENDIAYSRGQSIQEIRNLLNYSYANGFREYDYYTADSLSVSDAKDFYNNRIKLLKSWLSSDEANQFSDNEKEYLMTQYENLNTPLNYDYMCGWRQLFEFIPTIIILTMLILTYIVSGVFSNEFSWKSDAVFFSSFHGRDSGISAKIKAGFCIVTGIYLFTLAVFTGAVLLYLGADGWNLPVQASSTSWKCFYHISNLQKYLIISIGGYIGCLFFSLLGMLVSAKLKSSVPAVMLPVIVIFLPSFLSNISNPIINMIISLLPDQLLQVGTALNYFNLYSIGGMILGEVPMLFILYIPLIILMVPILYHTYRHSQIS